MANAGRLQHPGVTPILLRCRAPTLSSKGYDCGVVTVSRACTILCMLTIPFPPTQAPNMHFNLVSEPHSQLNALFHTLGMGDATFIKAIGFVHNSNHTLIIDSGLNDCSAGASSSHSMDVLVDDSPMAAINKQRVHVHGATNVASLLIDPNINITYKSSKDKEQVIVQTQQVLYTIFRNRNACHLDVDFVVLDANLVGYVEWLCSLLFVGVYEDSNTTPQGSCLEHAWCAWADCFMGGWRL